MVPLFCMVLIALFAGLVFFTHLRLISIVIAIGVLFVEAVLQISDHQSGWGDTVAIISSTGVLMIVLIIGNINNKPTKRSPHLPLHERLHNSLYGD